VAAAAAVQKDMDTELEGVQDARWHVCWLSHVTLGATSAKPLDFLLNQPSSASTSGCNNSRAGQRASAKQRQQSVRGGPAVGDDANLLHELQLSREETSTRAAKAHALAQHRTRQEAAVHLFTSHFEAARDLRDTVREKMQLYKELEMDENGDAITVETKKRWMQEFAEAAANAKAAKVALDADMAASLKQYMDAESSVTSENHSSAGDTAALEVYTAKRRRSIMEAFGKEGRIGMEEEDVQARALLEWYDFWSGMTCPRRTGL